LQQILFIYYLFIGPSNSSTRMHLQQTNSYITTTENQLVETEQLIPYTKKNNEKTKF